jgi:hypothetical protein
MSEDGNYFVNGGVISDCASETAQYMFPGFWIVNYYKYIAGVINNYQKEYAGHDPDDLVQLSQYWLITAVDSSSYFLYCVAREATIKISGDSFFSYVYGALFGGSLYTVISIPIEDLSKNALLYGIASSASYTLSFKYLPLWLAVVPGTIAIELGTAALFLQGGYKEGSIAAASFAFVGAAHQLVIEPLKNVWNGLQDDQNVCVGSCKEISHEDL